MADNEASIGIRAYLIDQLSTGMSAISDSFASLKTSVESAVVPAVEAMDNLAKAEEDVVGTSESVAKGIQDIVIVFDTFDEALRTTMSTAEEASNVLDSLASSATPLDEELIAITDASTRLTEFLLAMSSTAGMDAEAFSALEAKVRELDTELGLGTITQQEYAKAADELMASVTGSATPIQGMLTGFENLTSTASGATQAISSLDASVKTLAEPLIQIEEEVAATVKEMEALYSAAMQQANAEELATEASDKEAQALSAVSVAIARTTADAKELADAMAQDGASAEYIDRISTSFQLLNSQLSAGTISVDEYKAGVASIEATLAQGAAAVDEFNASLTPMESDAQGNVFALMMLQQQLQQVATTVKQVALDMITSAGNQEEAMTRLQNVLNMTDKQFEAMKQYVVDTANTSTFSAEQIAQSFTLMAEKSYTAGDIIKSGMGQALINMAEAIGIDVMPATDLLILTMKTFGATADQAKQYTDMLTYSFQHGIPNATQLQQAITQVGSTAATLKIPFDQISATLDWLANNGMENASQAGTSLRYMLTGLTTPTTKAAEELANLGIMGIDPNNAKLQAFVANLNSASKTQYTLSGSVQNLSGIYTAAQKLGQVSSSQSYLEWATSIGAVTDTLYDKSGKLKSLPDIIDQVVTAVQKLPAGAQQSDALANLFNIKSGTAAKLLANAKDIKAQLMKILEGTDNSTAGGGAAASQADKIKADFNTKLGELKTSWTSFMATVGTPIISGLKPIIDDANNIVGAMQKSHSSWLLFGAVVLVVLAVLLPVAAAIVGVVVMFAMLGAAGAAVVGPILIIIGTVIALAIAAGLIVAKWGPVSTFFSAMGKGIQVAWSATVAWLQSAFSSMGSWISSAFSGTLVAVNNINKGIQAPFIAMGKWVMDVFNSISKATKPFNDAISKTLGPAIKTAVSEVKSAFSSMSSAVLPILKSAGQALSAAGPPAKAFAQAVGGQIMAALKALSPWITVVVGVFKGLNTGAASAGTGLGNFGKMLSSFLVPTLVFLGGVLKVIGVIIVGIILVAVALVIGIFNGLIKAIGSLIAMFLNLVGAVITMGKGIELIFSGFFTLIMGLLTLNGKTINQGFATIWNGIKMLFSGAATFLVAAVTGLIAIVLNLFGGFFSGILGFIANLSNGFRKGSGDAMLAFANSINTGLASVMNTLAAVPGQVLLVLSGLPSQMMNFGANLINMFVSGILNNVSKVTDAVGSVAGTIKNFLGFASPTKLGPMSLSHTFMPAMMQMFATGITGNSHLVTNAVAGVAQGIHTGITSPTVAGIRNANGASSSMSSASANHHTYNVALQVDGKTMSNVVMTNIAGDLKMNQMSTSWR